MYDTGNPTSTQKPGVVGGVALLGLDVTFRVRLVARLAQSMA